MTEIKKTPNQSLQTISCSVTVAAEPLCVPPHEMSDLKRWAKMASPKNSHLPEFYVYVFKANGVPFYVGIGRDKRASDRVRYIEYLIRREKEGRPLKKGLSSRVMMALLKEKVSITFDYLWSDITREFALKKEKEEIISLCIQGYNLLNIHYNPDPPKSDLEFVSHMKLKLKTTEPNQALQTISRTGPVAAEPLCGPALEMSDC